MPKALFIAGASSGCGKTSLALGLMAAFTRRGLSVQGFKSGPDFIDPGLHRLATGLPSHNLDGWMLGHDEVLQVFRRNHAGCDLSIIEGAMGLFDGMAAVSEEGSSAQLAKILDLPVTLLVNARGMGRSAAALVKGYADFDPDLRLNSVIFNMTGSPAHGRILAQALSVLPGITTLGSLPRQPALHLPARTLGLVTAEDLDRREERLRDLADWVEASLDLDALLNSLPNVQCPALHDTVQMPELRIGYARDRAFCFYYEENLRLLRQTGVELVPFSPLEDHNLPPALHSLYLGGGYPDLYAETLAANTAMLAKVREFCDSGKPVYAEGGGFAYLMRSLVTIDGREFPMAGVFNLRCRVQRQRQALGYREVRFTAQSPLGQAGTTARGHEFHYMLLEGHDGAQIYESVDQAGQSRETSGFLKGNCLGGLAHLHFGSNPDMAAHFVST